MKNKVAVMIYLERHLEYRYLNVNLEEIYSPFLLGSKVGVRCYRNVINMMTWQIFFIDWPSMYSILLYVYSTEIYKPYMFDYNIVKKAVSQNLTS